MIPLLAAGLVMRAYGQDRANQDQADAEEQNASYFREQAKYADIAGERAVLVHDRESVIMYGEQASAFAKAGVSASGSSLFMAKEMLFSQQESSAIKMEAEMNVRLALLRADQAQSEADALRDPTNRALGAVGGIATGLGSIL